MMKIATALTPLVLFLSLQGCTSEQEVGPADFCAKYDINVFKQGEKVSTCRLVLEERGDTEWELRLVSHTPKKSELKAALLASLHENNRIVSVRFEGRMVDVTLEAILRNNGLQPYPQGNVRLYGRLDGHAFVGSVLKETATGPRQIGHFVAACDHRL